MQYNKQELIKSLYVLCVSGRTPVETQILKCSVSSEYIPSIKELWIAMKIRQKFVSETLPSRKGGWE